MGYGGGYYDDERYIARVRRSGRYPQMSGKVKICNKSSGQYVCGFFGGVRTFNSQEEAEDYLSGQGLNPDNYRIEAA